jgi:hypothetical protein
MIDKFIIIIIGLIVVIILSLLAVNNYFSIRSVKPISHKNVLQANGISLFIEFYISSSPERRNEIEHVLVQNIKCNEIQEVHIIIHEPREEEYLQNLSSLQELPRKWHIHKDFFTTRSSFGDIFSRVNKVYKDDNINIVANNDIAFDSSVKLLLQLRKNEAIILNRYCPFSKQMAFLCHDAWAVRGPVKIPLTRLKFSPGMFGCDFALTCNFQKAGYTVFNPSLSIKSYHYHRSNIKTQKISDFVHGKKLAILPTHWT